MSTTWNHASLDLGWIKGGPGQDNWADARALVWHGEPIYCVASVNVINKEFTINTSGWHGMTPNDKESLVTHLESLRLTPLAHS